MVAPSVIWHVCRKLSEQQSVERPSDTSITSAITHKPRDHAVCSAVLVAIAAIYLFLWCDEVTAIFD
jgi:hypothetical protein